MGGMTMKHETCGETRNKGRRPRTRTSVGWAMLEMLVNPTMSEKRMLTLSYFSGWGLIPCASFSATDWRR